jgi:hypothetical protein
MMRGKPLLVAFDPVALEHHADRHRQTAGPLAAPELARAPIDLP